MERYEWLKNEYSRLIKLLNDPLFASEEDKKEIYKRLDDVIDEMDSYMSCI